jgi:hypothetical protein
MRPSQAPSPRHQRQRHRVASRPHHGWRPPRWSPCSSASVASCWPGAVLLGIGGVVLAGRDNGSDRQTTAARQADDNTLDASGAAGTAGVIDGGDLGDQRDPMALNTALQERLGGAADTAAQAFSESAPEAPATARSAAQCQAEAQTAGSDRVGALVLTARLRWQGEPAVVLVFSAPDQTQLARRAFVMAQRDCRLLVVQSF